MVASKMLKTLTSALALYATRVSSASDRRVAGRQIGRRYRMNKKIQVHELPEDFYKLKGINPTTDGMKKGPVRLNPFTLENGQVFKFIGYSKSQEMCVKLPYSGGSSLCGSTGTTKVTGKQSLIMIEVNGESGETYKHVLLYEYRNQSEIMRRRPSKRYELQNYFRTEGIKLLPFAFGDFCRQDLSQIWVAKMKMQRLLFDNDKCHLAVRKFCSTILIETPEFGNSLSPSELTPENATDAYNAAKRYLESVQLNPSLLNVTYEDNNSLSLEVRNQRNTFTKKFTNVNEVLAELFKACGPTKIRRRLCENQHA